jgi:nicotinamidase-related amidase
MKARAAPTPSSHPAAEVGVPGSARDAGERVYTVFLIEDACATLDPSDHDDTFRGLSWAVERSTSQMIELLAG